MKELVKEVFIHTKDQMKMQEFKMAVLLLFEAIFFLMIYQKASFVIVLVLLLSIFIALISYLPKVGFFFKSFGLTSTNDNPLCFVDIAQYNSPKYYERLKGLVGDDNSEHMLKMYHIKHSITYARRATVKLKQVQLSAFLCIVSLILFGVMYG